MSTYNRAEKFLPAAIDSVLGQTFQDWELIIVDDCSTDNTPEVVAKYWGENEEHRKESRIKYFGLRRNSGSDTKPKNKGLLEAKGEYIAYLDDDVTWFPMHLEMLVNHLDASPELDVVYSDMVWYNAEEENPKNNPGIAMDFDGQFLQRRNFIDTSEVLHRRELAFDVGGFDETLPRFIDWNMWVRMYKSGGKFERVPVISVRYSMHKKTKSQTVEARSFKCPDTGMIMFEPTFDPAGCPIYLPYLGNDREDQKNPKVAIFTKTYGRLDYTKRTFKSLAKSTKYPYDQFVWDNGSQDGTPEWLKGMGGSKDMPSNLKYVHLNDENVGITKASNALVDEIKEGDYQIIIHMDNDCEFMTKGWLETFIDIWKRNHRVYMSPYPEGLVHNPGGAPRVGVANIGQYMVEVTMHIGGLCAFIDARAYDNFRWTDDFLHGNQDSEASNNFRGQGYMPCYIPLHRVMHMDTTEGQEKKYNKYFERRKKEKATKYAE